MNAPIRRPSQWAHPSAKVLWVDLWWHLSGSGGWAWSHLELLHPMQVQLCQLMDTRSKGTYQGRKQASAPVPLLLMVIFTMPEWEGEGSAGNYSGQYFFTPQPSGMPSPARAPHLAGWRAL